MFKNRSVLRLLRISYQKEEGASSVAIKDIASYPIDIVGQEIKRNIVKNTRHFASAKQT